MFAKSTFMIAAGALSALMLAAGPAGAQTSEVAPVKITGEAPTSVRINVTGLQTVAVRKLVRGAAVTVCDNAVSNRELSWADGDWCVSATIDHSMDKFRRLRAASSYQVALTPQFLTIATR